MFYVRSTEIMAKVIVNPMYPMIAMILSVPLCLVAFVVWWGSRAPAQDKLETVTACVEEVESSSDKNDDIVFTLEGCSVEFEYTRSYPHFRRVTQFIRPGFKLTVHYSTGLFSQAWEISTKSIGMSFSDLPQRDLSFPSPFGGSSANEPTPTLSAPSTPKVGSSPRVLVSYEDMKKNRQEYGSGALKVSMLFAVVAVGMVFVYRHSKKQWNNAR
jgi:hypothetical protein